MQSHTPTRVTYGGLLSCPLQAQNARVRDLERLLLERPQVDLGTKDLTHGGLHVRWIFVPAGTALTGAITRLDNVCIVLGDIDVTTEDGPVRLQGFNVLPACAGAKRAGVARADTWWATVWRTDLTELEEIEDEMTSESMMLQTRALRIAQEDRKKLEG